MGTLEDRNGRRIGQYLREAVPGLVAAYLFGSTASGEATDNSDLDVALLAAAPLDALRRFEIQEEVAAIAGRDVDLLDLLSASTVMRMQVISRGVLLVECDQSTRVRFEDYTYSAYARLNEERRPILERIRAERRIHAG